MASSFHRAVRWDDIAEGAAHGLVIAGWPVLLARSDDAIFATIDRCTHAASGLSTGRVRRGSIMCPLHGARFELATGRCIGAAYQPLMTFEIRLANEWIEIAVPDEPPGFEHMPARAKA